MQEISYCHDVQNKASMGMMFVNNHLGVAFAFANPKDQFVKAKARAAIKGRLSSSKQSLTFEVDKETYIKFRPKLRERFFYLTSKERDAKDSSTYIKEQICDFIRAEVQNRS